MSDLDVDGLPLGCWVHVMENGSIERQGSIINQVKGDGEPWFVVSWYSWLDGEPTWMSVVKVSDMVSWRLYDSYDDWAEAGKNRASDG